MIDQRKDDSGSIDKTIGGTGETRASPGENDPSRRQDASAYKPASPDTLSGDAQQQREEAEDRGVEQKAAASWSQQGEEEKIRHQVAASPDSPPNADDAPPASADGTMRQARGEVRADPDEQQTRYQSDESRRGE